jgi:hypothetical protein
MFNYKYIVLLLFIMSALGLSFIEEKNEVISTLLKGINPKASYRIHPEEIIAVKEFPVEALAFKEIEDDFERKTDNEIMLAIESNESWAKKMNFIAKANAQALSAQDSSDFTRYMRLNTVLHKILLERQLETAERELL